jgi:threonine dehydrogenase-like Zn-dependent dehydrogenase
MAGVVAKLGPDADGITIGQPVAIEPMQLAGCGQCPECLRGASNICLHRGSNEALRVSAGFSEYDVAALNHVYALPPGLPLEVAALADVYACAVHALNRVPVTAADIVVIIGNGTVALALGQLARLRGAQVIMIGRRQKILEQAMSAGAAGTVINLMQTDASPELARLTGDRGARVVFEAVGGTSNDTIQLAIHAAAAGGEIGILGAFVGNVQVPYREANRKEISLRWCNGYAMWNGQREFQIALDLLAQGRVSAASLITHRFGLEEVGKAFQVSDNKSQSNAIKVMLEPG